MTDNNVPIRLTREQLKPAAEVLARAFHAYPLLSAYYPDKSEREKITLYFLSVAIFSGFRYGEVCATSPNLEGVAVWFAPGGYPVYFCKLMRSVPLFVMYGLARYGGAKMRQIGKYLDSAHLRLAPFGHWYLQVLGVDPVHQGKGYSSLLLKGMFDRIDKEDIPCYLETLDENNVSLYEHFGFKVLEESKIPGTGLTNWAMLREKAD